MKKSSGGLNFDPSVEIYNKQDSKLRPEILSELKLKKGTINAIFGPRGMGKTTIIKLFIKKLIEGEKINPDNILYYSCHNIDTYEQLNEIIKIFLDWREKEKKELFIFIDEITMVKDWQKGVGYLNKAGKLNNSAVVLSGSTLNDKLLKESEKVKINILASLSFKEFLGVMNKDLAAKVNRENYQNYCGQLEFYLDIYFLTGGFISAINEYKSTGAVSQNQYISYLNWLLSDLSKLGRNTVLMRQIVESIISNLGEPLGYQTIAQKTKAKTHLTIAEYLNILEEMFVIRAVYQEDGGKPSSRKAKKIYFQDPFIFWLFYCYVYGSVSYWQFSRERLHRPEIFNALVENIIFSQMIKGETISDRGALVTYWRDNIKKIEINFLKKKGREEKPVLIRFANDITEADRKIFFQAGYKKGIIVSKSELDLSGAVKIMPLTYFLLFEK